MTTTATTYYYGTEYEITDDQADSISRLRDRNGSLRFLGRLYGTKDVRVSIAVRPGGRDYFDIDHLGGVREANRR